MTREEAKSLLPILQAFVEGKTIEKWGYGDTWNPIEDLWLNNPPCDYRIKPEPKYRPFANAEECWQEMQKHQPFGWLKRFDNYTQIVSLEPSSAMLVDTVGNLSRNIYKDNKHINFADGTPFGLKVEEE